MHGEASCLASLFEIKLYEINRSFASIDNMAEDSVGFLELLFKSLPVSICFCFVLVKTHLTVVKTNHIFKLQRVQRDGAYLKGQSLVEVLFH